ncbi:hypothetical protein MSAN_01390600 [Mycena sanguinolenta]|uniref:Uncharacterized protein n=1 Tax=Mycena sanguinolenta TaxID=230812 RepID=A0A8H6Y987_9AGAR|nr:hypothetical protein MSAN_01390600 [Mycena sanguinolenta]
MLWYPLARRTRSGKEFSSLSLPTLVTPLQSQDFDFAPLVQCAVAAESDDQDDHEDEDDYEDENDDGDEDAAPDIPHENVGFPPCDPFNDLDDLDKDERPWSLDDQWNDVDDANPSYHRLKRRRSSSPSFEQVVASAKPPHKAAHRQRPAKPHRLAQKHAAATLRRQKKRRKLKQQHGHVPAASAVNEHVAPAIPLATDLDTSSLPSTLGAYAGKVEDAAEKRGSTVRRSLANLVGLGFHVVEWDGITPRPIIDKRGRIIVVLAGQPQDATYREAAKHAFEAIRDAGIGARFPASMRRHRRGLFAAVNVGLSYGKGQRTPSWLDTKEYTTIAERLLANSYIGRLAGFADAAFALWAPRLYQHYRSCDEALQTHHPGFRPTIRDSDGRSHIPFSSAPPSTSAGMSGHSSIAMS